MRRAHATNARTSGLSSAARQHTATMAGARPRTRRATRSFHGSADVTDRGLAATARPALTAANRSSKPVIRAPMAGGRPLRASASVQKSRATGSSWSTHTKGSVASAAASMGDDDASR